MPKKTSFQITLWKNKCPLFFPPLNLLHVHCLRALRRFYVRHKSRGHGEVIHEHHLNLNAPGVPSSLLCCIVHWSRAKVDPDTHDYTKLAIKCVCFLQAVSNTVSNTGLFYCPVIKCHLKSHISAGDQDLHPLTRFRKPNSKHDVSY